MKLTLSALLFASLVSCASQGKRGGGSPDERVPPQKPDEEPGAIDHSQNCLAVVSWQEAIEGQANTRVLSQIFTHPEDPKVQNLVKLAIDGKANCPTP